MNRTDAPKKQPVPFGINGSRENLLATTPAGDNQASYDAGFPPVTMLLKSAGGLPPKGQDMNQILFELSAIGRWLSAGALNTFDATFSSGIGGYPKGAVLLSNDGATIYVSTIDANTNDPNSVTTGWLNLLNFLGAAPLASPSFTGVPTAPTAASGTNTTQIASTAFVSAVAGRKIAEQWITSSRTLTLNPLTKHIKVTITGGGGGGAGAFNGGGASDNFSGAGGAAGATCIKWLNVSVITNYSIVIGIGGTEVTKGGDSTFNGIVARGGNPAATTGVNSAGGTGVAGTGGDINIPGGDGGDGQNGTRFIPGNGGASIWGGSRRSGQGNISTPVIPKALIPGGGGGGAFDLQVLSTRFYGGQGGDGICLIEEFS